MDDVPVDVCQSEVASSVSVGELFVIEAEQLEHGGVEVVDMHRILGCFKSKFVCGAVSLSTFDSPRLPSRP